MRAEEASSSHDLVSVGHAYGPMEAAIAVSLLDAAGIFAHVQMHNTACNAWHYITAFGGMAVTVPSFQAADAIKLLSDFSPSHQRRWPLAVLLLAGLASLAVGVTLPGSGFYSRRPPEQVSN